MTDELFDLYLIFLDLIKNGKFCHHPYTWLKKPHGINALLMMRDFSKNEGKTRTSLYLGDNEITHLHRYNLKRNNQLKHYICSSDISSLYIESMNSITIDEESIQDSIEAARPDFFREYFIQSTKSKIDLVSNNTILEIKKFGLWKHALGQILTYAYSQPNKEKWIILFSANINKKDVSIVKDICGLYDVNVGFIDKNSNLNEWLNNNNI